MTIRKQICLSPSSPTSIKTRFTCRFLRALKKLNKNSIASPSINERYKRYHKVKIASYASMASAVGSKRTWSHVLLRQIRNRRLSRVLVKRSRIRALKRKRISTKPREDFGYGEASKLRELIPGGKVMDVCSLLDETAHYVKCLNMQVKMWEG